MSEPAPTRLKSLLQQRLWHGYSTFCLEYDKVAKAIDAKLVGTYPSRAQFHRWLSGTVKKLPYAHHRAVLESMFPDWSIEQLFDVADTNGQYTSISPSRQLAKRQIPGLLGVVEASLESPDRPAPQWEDLKPVEPAGAISTRLQPSPISAYSSDAMGSATRVVGRKLVELSRLLRLSEAEVCQLANLAGHIVDLELHLSIDIDPDGKAHVFYQHDYLNLSDTPLSRTPREIWFKYAHAPLTLTPTQHNDRRIVIQRVHDAGSMAKFALKFSPPIQPGQRTTVRYTSEGGLFQDAWYWREAIRQYTRHVTFTIRHRGIGRLTDCAAHIEHPGGSDTSITEGLLWDYDGSDVSITLVADYLRPGQFVELRWDADRAAR